MTLTIELSLLRCDAVIVTERRDFVSLVVTALSSDVTLLLVASKTVRVMVRLSDARRRATASLRSELEVVDVQLATLVSGHAELSTSKRSSAIAVAFERSSSVASREYSISSSV